MSKICFLGDVYAETDKTISYWPQELKADCCVFNFEYVYDDQSLHYTDAAENKINLKGKGTPFLCGYDQYVVSLANNHIMDFTDQGCNSTVSFLKKEGVVGIGISRKTDQSDHFVAIVDHVTMSAYLQKHLIYPLPEGSVWYVHELNEQDILRDAKSAWKHGSRFHVVYLHWGTELIAKPWPNQVHLAHRLIDSGYVQMVVGMHSHCIQSYEIYKGKYIFYGLGNAAFPRFGGDDAMFSHGTPQMKSGSYWGKWGKKSIAILFDTENFKVKLYELFYNRKKFHCRSFPEKNHFRNNLIMSKKDIKVAAFRALKLSIEDIFHFNFKMASIHFQISKRVLEYPIPDSSAYGFLTK